MITPLTLFYYIVAIGGALVLIAFLALVAVLALMKLVDITSTPEEREICSRLANMRMDQEEFERKEGVK